MDDNPIYDICDVYEALDIEDLEKRAKKLAAFSISAATTGNTVVIFSMLVLQEVLEQLAANPLANVTTIIQITSSIASLNNSIRLVP